MEGVSPSKGRRRTYEHKAPAKLGLSDDEFAVHPTVFATDLLRDRVVLVSGVHLAGPSGKFVTGETLTVDGGGQLWG